LTALAVLSGVMWARQLWNASSVAHQRTSAVRSYKLRTISCTSVCAISDRRVLCGFSQRVVSRVIFLAPRARTGVRRFLELVAACEASDLTSCATTANPLPYSPARAASMVAFSASRLVWLAMVSLVLANFWTSYWMLSVMVLICSVDIIPRSFGCGYVL